jgi:Flp pilus assembly protein TadB
VYLPLVWVTVRATMRQYRRTQLPRSANRVGLIMVLRVSALSALAVAVVPGLRLANESVAMWLIVSAVAAALGEVLLRVRWPRSG